MTPPRTGLSEGPSVAATEEYARYSPLSEETIQSPTSLDVVSIGKGVGKFCHLRLAHDTTATRRLQHTQEEQGIVIVLQGQTQVGDN